LWSSHGTTLHLAQESSLCDSIQSGDALVPDA
jgi:hypothetical protein